MKKIAVILAGCGRFDGSEVQESVLSLLSISQLGAHYQCFSLDKDQQHVTDHLNGKTINQTRNQMIESARIARGDVLELSTLNPLDYDALVIPGGNGVAYNLFDLALSGQNFVVNDLVKKICQKFTSHNKPVGFICIAPAMIPKIYDFPVKLTIGKDPETIQLIKSLNGIHEECPAQNCVIDEKYKIVSAPAYMSAQNINEAYLGIHALVKAIIDL